MFIINIQLLISTVQYSEPLNHWKHYYKIHILKIMSHPLQWNDPIIIYPYVEKILLSIGSNIFSRKSIRFSILNRENILDPILTNVFSS